MHDFFLPDFIPKNKIIVVDRGDIGKPSSSVNEMLVNLKSIADESLGFVDTYLYFNLKSSQISGENLQFLVYSHLANNNDIALIDNIKYIEYGDSVKKGENMKQQSKKAKEKKRVVFNQITIIIKQIFIIKYF